MKLLLVEDDLTIALGLQYSLNQEQFDVVHANNVATAKEYIKTQTFDLALLDVMLPDGNGYELCEHIKQNKDIPIIFLTACDDEVNVVMGLDLGADDYISKPFRIRELISRIRSVLRRTQKSDHTNHYKINNVTVFPNSAKVYKNEIEVNLTAVEYKLFLTFLQHQNQVLTRAQLLDLIFDYGGEFVNDNTLTVYIKRLREKLEDDLTKPIIIHTVRGIGYKVGNADV